MIEPPKYLGVRQRLDGAFWVREVVGLNPTTQTTAFSGYCIIVSFRLVQPVMYNANGHCVQETGWAICGIDVKVA